MKRTTKYVAFDVHQATTVASVWHDGGGVRSTTVHQQYDVTPDDQRFVMIRDLGGQEASELIVVENFFEELKAKVGN